jgi:DNA topoisomerase VI subunit B
MIVNWCHCRYRTRDDTHISKCTLTIVDDEPYTVRSEQIKKAISRRSIKSGTRVQLDIIGDWHAARTSLYHYYMALFMLNIPYIQLCVTIRINSSTTTQPQIVRWNSPNNVRMIPPGSCSSPLTILIDCHF